MCEDYRAAATIDLEHDRQSRSEGAKIECPLLVLWGTKGKVDQWYNPLAVWLDYCRLVPKGGGIEAGHYLAEEAPESVTEALRAFFST